MGAKLAFPLYHWHFPCRILSDDCFQSVEPPVMLLPVLQALLCCFSLPTAYWPFQYSAVLQWDFLTIIRPAGVVWKTGCCNTHTTCTISLSWGLRKIALLCLENSSLKLAEAAAELLGYADPDAVTACISLLMSRTSKPLLGALWKLLYAATALHADVAKWIHSPYLCSKELPWTGTKFSPVLPCWKMLYRNAKWIH